MFSWLNLTAMLLYCKTLNQTIKQAIKIFFSKEKVIIFMTQVMYLRLESSCVFN